MNPVVTVFASLILVSLLATIYSFWAYHNCPDCKSHRPLIFPIICSIAWFLIGVDQLVAYQHKTHGTADGVTILLLIIVTLVALVYFVKDYVMEGSIPHK